MPLPRMMIVCTTVTVLLLLLLLLLSLLLLLCRNLRVPKRSEDGAAAGHCGRFGCASASAAAATSQMEQQHVTAEAAKRNSSKPQKHITTGMGIQCVQRVLLNPKH